MKDLDKKIIEKVIASFKNNPEDWTFFQNFTAENKREDIEIWLCNGICALNIKVKGYKIGGLSFWTFPIASLIPWRRRVWKLFKTAQLEYLKKEGDDAKKQQLQELEAWVAQPIQEIVRH